jgi:hypothetical protein
VVDLALGGECIDRDDVLADELPAVPVAISWTTRLSASVMRNTVISKRVPPLAQPVRKSR